MCCSILQQYRAVSSDINKMMSLVTTLRSLIVDTSVTRRLSVGVDDGDEIRFERRSAHKEPVDVRLLCQLLAVVRGHGT